MKSQLIAPVSVWPSNVVDHQIPMPERFILAIGPVAQQLGIDEQVGGDIVIWDQQEHKVVMVVGAEYAQMICLERQSDKACFSALVDWMNKLGNEGLESENIPPTKPPFLVERKNYELFSSKVLYGSPISDELMMSDAEAQQRNADLVADGEGHLQWRLAGKAVES